MTKRMWAALAGVAVVGGLTIGIAPSFAHQCPDGDTTSDECHDTTVYSDWRGNYVPLFDLPDREEEGAGTDGESQRRDAQRWRDECTKDGVYEQQCQWSRGGFSAVPSDTDDGDTPRPNEWHVGYAANHCFLFELAHDCDRHEESEFDTHDSHGGAVYADVCLSENDDSKHCDDGLSDTQAGVTVVDHLDCPVGCMDEYHVVRPLDQPYTEEQMNDSAEAAASLDPQGYVCGDPDHSYCP